MLLDFEILLVLNFIAFSIFTKHLIVEKGFLQKVYLSFKHKWTLVDTQQYTYD